MRAPHSPVDILQAKLRARSTVFSEHCGIICRDFRILYALEAIPDHVDDEPTWPTEVTPRA